MKVLHLIDSEGLYGAEKMLLTLVGGQRNSGVDACILSSTNNAEVRKPLVQTAKEQGLPVIEWLMKDGLNFFQALKIVSYAKENNFSVLHAHGYKFDILMGLIPLFIRKLPLVCTLHGYLSSDKFTKLWLYQQVDRRVVAKAQATVFVSHAMTQRDEFKELPIKNKHVIYNGIQFDYTKSGNKSPLLEKIYPSKEIDGLHIIVAVGRLSPEKGFNDLIKAFSIIYPENPNLRLLILGEGEEREGLETLIKELGLIAVVSLPGFVDDVASIIKRSDLLVMSSYTEGMPITLLEAVVENIPVIATKVGGIPELLSDYKKAIMIEPGDSLGISGAVKDVLGNEDMKKWTDVSDVEEKFSCYQMVNGYLELYNSLGLNVS